MTGGRRRWLAGLAAAAVVVVAVVALRDGGDDAADPGGQKVEVRDGGVVRVAGTLEVTGFNPNTSEDSGPALQDIAVSVYPSVFRVHPDFSVRLDQTFMVDAELTGQAPQTIIYRIRPEARWSDGVPIGADDFRYQWQHLNGANPRTDAASTAGYDRIQQVTGSDDGKTVTVVFKQPFAEWQSLFANLVPAHHLRRQPGGWNNGLDKHPEKIPSGGPFEIAGFRRGETVTLRRNDRYWGPKAHLDQIVIQLVPDSDAQLDALRNHEADLIRPQPTADLINHVRQLSGVHSQVRPTLSFEHLTFNLSQPILADPAVRRAIATAIDTGQLVDRLVRPMDASTQPLGNRIWLPGQAPYQDHADGYGKGDTGAASDCWSRPAGGWAPTASTPRTAGGCGCAARRSPETRGAGPRVSCSRTSWPRPASASSWPAPRSRPSSGSGWTRATSTSPTSHGPATRSSSPAARTPTGPTAPATTAGSPTPRSTSCSGGRPAS